MPVSRWTFLLMFAAIAPLPGARADSAGSSRPEIAFVPMVRMQTDRRVAPEEFARRAGLGTGAHGATGLIRCGDATGTGQLTLRNDLITTAAHVLFAESGMRRPGCVFEPVGGAAVAIDPASVRAGSRTPFAEPATRDWAVGRLVRPIAGVEPYKVGAVPASGAPVVMCAGGNGAHGRMGAEQCRTRGVMGTAPDGIREIAIDCNAGPGSSGAALLSGQRMVAVYVGYRSTDPHKVRAFSDTHYNFAITVEGAFRNALFAR